MDTRARILAALEAGGVSASATGQFHAPCVIVEPGDPWTAQSRMRGRLLARWQLTALAGKTDSEAAFAALGALADAVDAALLAIDGVQLPAWSMPTDRTLGNVPYAAMVATIETHTAEV